MQDKRVFTRVSKVKYIEQSYRLGGAHLFTADLFTEVNPPALLAADKV